MEQLDNEGACNEEPGGHMTPHTEGARGGAAGVRLGFMEEEPGRLGRCRSRKKEREAAQGS